MEMSQEESFYQQLINPEEKIGLRYQAVFQLKHLNTELAIKNLVRSYEHLSQSVLLSHQVLYTLGQLQDNKIGLTKEFLITVVNNPKDNNLSRHQAAEALANYFLPELIELYTKHMHSECNQLRWTCEIAIEKVKKAELKEKYGKLYYGTKEPAAPFQKQEFNNFLQQFKAKELFKQQGYLGLLIRQDIPLFIKYRIMYFMRNENNDEVKKTLCLLLSKKYYKTQTSLLKHEICFILGQIGCQNFQHLVRQCIQNEQEQAIVRHEALAAVASQSKDANYLDKFLSSPERLIKQSAEVAQFSIHYWNQ